MQPALITLAEKASWPDFILRAGVRSLCGRTRKRMAAIGNGHEKQFCAGHEPVPGCDGHR